MNFQKQLTSKNIKITIAIIFRKIVSSLSQNQIIQSFAHQFFQFLKKDILNQNTDKFNMQVVINLFNTKYSVVQNAAKQLGLIVSHENDTTSSELAWDLKWTDCSLGNEFVKKMNRNQRINYFIGISSIARKNLLMMNLYTMRKYFPEEYDFFPQTFLFPGDNKKIIRYQKEKVKQNLKVTFIVKPQAGCQGRGIYLCQHFSEIDPQSKSIVQQYISNPMLFEGLKFDFRVYVLLKNVSQLEIYLYKEGLVRFATEKYEQPSKSNLDDLCLHLTNYAINKHSPKYEFNKTMSNLNYGHKKSLAQFFRSLASIGCNSYRIWRQIKQCIIKTIISVQPHLHSQYRKAQPKNQSQSLCYQVLGFDFMMNENKKVYLLQVNQSPSFSTQTPLDFLVKNFLIKDTLRILMYDKERKRFNLQFRSKRVKTEQDRQTKKSKSSCLENLPSQILGNYQRIFPLTNESTQKNYDRMLMTVKADYHKTGIEDVSPSSNDESLNQIGDSSSQLKIKAQKQKSLKSIHLIRKTNHTKQSGNYESFSNQVLSPKIQLNQNNRRRLMSLKKEMLLSQSLDKGIIKQRISQTSNIMHSIQQIHSVVRHDKSKSLMVYQTIPHLNYSSNVKFVKLKTKSLKPINVDHSPKSLSLLSENFISLRKPCSVSTSSHNQTISPHQTQNDNLLSNIKSQAIQSRKNISINTNLSKLSWYENKLASHKGDIRSHLKRYVQFLNPIEKAAGQRIGVDGSKDLEDDQTGGG